MSPLKAPENPPVARRRPHTVRHHGIAIDDPYHWLKDPDYPDVKDPEILAYLKAENAYFDAAMAPYQGLVDTLFEELKGRIKEEDESVPVERDGWLYFWRFEKGAQYRRWYRHRADGGEAHLILDEPALARGLDYFKLGGQAVDPAGRRLAYAADTDGSENYTIRIKDLQTGAVLPDAIPGTAGSLLWAEDGETLIYVERNAQWRPFRVRAHRLGADPAADPILYEEADEAFFVGIGKTQSRRYLVLSAGDHVTQEVRLIPADAPLSPSRLIAPRRPGHEYYVDHGGGWLVVLTNDIAQDFRVCTAPEDAPEEAHWQELIAPAPGQYLKHVTAFGRVLAVEERIDGQDQIRLIDQTGGGDHRIAFPEAVFTVGLGANPEPDPDRLRLHYGSLISPATVYDYHLADRRLIVRKVQEIPSGYDKARFTTRRLTAPARDGAEIPVSLVEPVDRTPGGPVHLVGYGAYGYGYPPDFSTARLSLLERGFAVAIAHIRGGDELGRSWYQAGKLAARENSFNDFVDVARFLVADGVGTAGRMSASGGSAGGELMGAVANQAPELFAAIVAHVPFVDVLNTMLDANLPLTPIEWPEWGNPIEDAEAFKTILAYSPYDQIKAQPYPPLLLTAGLSDPRVTYWEPAKFCAKLRATKTNDTPVLLKTNMGAGHKGKSGRFDSLRETAEEFAFILAAFGMAG